MNKKFNINNYATVTLTEFGAKVYNARFDGLNMGRDWVQKLVEPGHILKSQVWTLFQDFGPHISLGMQNPFEGCIMTFDMEDFV